MATNAELYDRDVCAGTLEQVALRREARDASVFPIDSPWLREETLDPDFLPVQPRSRRTLPLSRRVFRRIP